MKKPVQQQRQEYIPGDTWCDNSVIIMMSLWRNDGVIIASYARWESLFSNRRAKWPQTVLFWKMNVFIAAGIIIASNQ